MSGTLPLAASIAAMDLDEVRGVLGARRVGDPAALGNPLALAIELLRSDSIVEALQGLDRESLGVLIAAPGPGDDRLRALGLLGWDGERTVQLPEVAAALAQLGAAPALHAGEGSGAAGAGRASAGARADRPAAGPTGFPADPAAGQHAEAAAPGEGSASVDTSSWFGPALTAASRAVALLRVLAHRPARLSRKGAVTVVAQRELAVATHDAPESSALLTELIRSADLAAPLAGGSSHEAVLVPTEKAERWLALPQPRRWLTLAEGLAARLPAPLRRALELTGGRGGPAAEAVLLAEYPLLPDTVLAASRRWVELAELLGLSVEGRLTTAAELLLGIDGGSVAGPSAGDDAERPSPDPHAALAEAERRFPALAQGVYLQPDLSVIVPGPLPPADEWALLELAETEQLGVASTMRLSAGSLRRAVRAGHGIGAIRELLERLSLTGIPQPLDFLLADIERSEQLDRQARAGSAGPGTGTDPAVSSRFVAPGRVRAVGERIADPAPVADTAVDGAPVPRASAEADDALAAAAERIFLAARKHPGGGELTHRLELAIRDRSPVRVTAAGPVERTFVLQPLAVSGGRLRAADRAAGVERTLPLSAIVSVEAA